MVCCLVHHDSSLWLYCVHLLLIALLSDKICDETRIGVYNHQRLNTTDGPEDFLPGYALLTEDPGKLRLFLEDIPEGTCKSHSIYIH